MICRRTVSLLLPISISVHSQARTMPLLCPTICGRSSESLPIVLNTRSCNLFTTPSRSSPSAAILVIWLFARRKECYMRRPKLASWPGAGFTSSQAALSRAAPICCLDGSLRRSLEPKYHL